MKTAIDITVVVPVFNEAQSLPDLQREIRAALEPLGRPWEVLYIDDRSTDGSLETLLAFQAEDSRVRVIRFRANCGQTAALAAGFEHARGEVVVPIDGDLQNDPADIPRLVEELEKGFDVVAGWRRRRHDGFFLRRVPSRLANRLINLVTGTRIHDTGCTLKAFRRQVVRNLPIYAEQHRFLAAMSASSGARVAEVEVNHRPRRYGESKYGIDRVFRVLLDLFTIKLIAQFSTRPLQYFGLFSLPFAGLGLGLLLMTSVDLEAGRVASEWDQQVVFAFILFLMLAIYYVFLGLLAELAVSAFGVHRRGIRGRLITHEELE